MGQRARFPVDFVFLSASVHVERQLQRQHLLSTKGHEGPRRTATATPFVHEGPRRTAKNCNCNTFCPRRATKDREELQRQHLLSTEGHEGPRRTATASSFFHEGPRRTATATPFVHEGPRRTAKNCSGQWSVVSGRGRLVGGVSRCVFLVWSRLDYGLALARFL